MSFKHSDLRSHAWSYLTGYSLADISVLSVISMPITQRDITNSTYYSFGVLESHVDDTARSGKPEKRSALLERASSDAESARRKALVCCRNDARKILTLR